MKRLSRVQELERIIQSLQKEKTEMLLEIEILKNIPSQLGTLSITGKLVSTTYTDLLEKLKAYEQELLDTKDTR